MKFKTSPKPPFKLVEKNRFIKFYSLYPNLVAKKSFKYLPFINIIFYIFHVMINTYGLKKLLNKRDEFLIASASFSEASKKFTIRDTNSQFHSIYFNSFKPAYEPEVTSVISLFVNKGETFIDIGSNWGHHSFYAAMCKGAKSIAFEPNPAVFSDLVRISKELDMVEKIQCHNVALSNFTGEISFTQDYFESGIVSIDNDFSSLSRSTKFFMGLLKKIFNVSGIQINAKVNSLDFYPIESVKLIKIDAEGAELDILLGARSVLGRCKPLVIFEYHSINQEKINKYLKLFDSLSYRLFVMDCHRENGSDAYILEINQLEGILPNKQYNVLAAPRDFKFNI